MGAEYVTVSSGFILGERVHPKLDPQSEAWSQKLVTCFSRHRPGGVMWPLLMSLWFNIRTDLYQAWVTCWLTSWARCTLDRLKGEELKVQRPPSCGISHSAIDLRGGWGVTQECETSQGCVPCAFAVKKPRLPGAWCSPCVLVYISCCLQVVLYPFSKLKVQIGPLKCS